MKGLKRVKRKGKIHAHKDSLCKKREECLSNGSECRFKVHSNTLGRESEIRQNLLPLGKNPSPISCHVRGGCKRVCRQPERENIKWICALRGALSGQRKEERMEG